MEKITIDRTFTLDEVVAMLNGAVGFVRANGDMQVTVGSVIDLANALADGKPKTRRGRPRKATASGNEVVAPRRRGRPPKDAYSRRAKPAKATAQTDADMPDEEMEKVPEE